MTESTNQKVEPRWRCIKEGEVSPYKILLCLFIRENFLVNPTYQAFPVTDQELPVKPPQMDKTISPRTLILIYKLISSPDLSFAKFKTLIEDPSGQVRPEVLRKFMKILSNLEDGSVGFLYELYHSIIDNKTCQVVVLRKKVEKSSPFGKFLRVVLMNVRRMSYPQVHYLYRQLCLYIGDFVKIRKKSLGLIPADKSATNPDSKTVTILTPKEDLNVTPTPPALPTPSTSFGVLSDTPGSSRTYKPILKLSAPSPYKFRGLETFQRMSDRNRKVGPGSLGYDIFKQYTVEYKRATGKWNMGHETELHKYVEDKRRRVALALEASKSLRNLYQGNPLLRTASQASLDSFGGDSELTGFGGRPAPKRRSGGRPTPIPLRTLPPRSPRKARSTPHLSQELVPIISELDDGYLPSDDDESMGPPLSTTLPVTPKSPRAKSKGKKGVKKSIGGSHTVSMDSPFPTSDTRPGDRTMKEIPASQKWDQVKWWSRKQIEKTLRFLANELVNTSTYSYSPKDISTFVETIVKNPSAQIILSQIYFVEYLNCLRLKDIRRCSESLRTSFDIRIKPNTSELNKGVPYAPYNFAVFYDFMGYKKDALRCLEEAFCAGHGAVDGTCLHYCHNMWSSLQNKPYTDAIVTVTKEVDNNMAYLHSLNVIANAFDYHYQRQPPEEVLYTLWHYNAECDLEEMESLLLLSLAGFFMAFGWHEMVSFPCQIILCSKLKWPLKAYCKALCILSDNLLTRGETDIPCAIMEYGETLFGYDASPVGELFSQRYATFKAFHCSLGYKPVPASVLATLYSYNKTEGLYWQAYTNMIQNEWEQASNMLNALKKILKGSEMSCENNDMKIRCLLLMAELNCLSGSPTAALGYIYEALDIAYSFSADHHITLCLSHIASIQCKMGLATAASKTIHKEMLCAIRSSNPWLNARLGVITVKISVKLQETIGKLSEKQLMDKLNAAEEMYKKWDNKYRLKEIYCLKAELLDKCEESSQNGNYYRKLLESTESFLMWSLDTCLL